MWLLDVLTELIVGTKAAEQARHRQWQREVARAEMALEQRALEASFMPKRTSPVSSSYGGNSSAGPVFCSIVSDSTRPSTPIDASLVFSPSRSIQERVEGVASFETDPTIAGSPCSATAEAGSSRPISSLEAARATHAADAEQDEHDLKLPSSNSKIPKSELQLPDQPDDRFGWTGFGRFQHIPTAPSEWIKAKLEEELTGPGSFNFFGTRGLEFRHPYEIYLRSRQQSAEDDDLPQESKLFLDSISFTSAAKRLEYRLRTKNSTTVDRNGCIIQKGFEISRPCTPEVIAPERSSRSDLVAPQATTPAPRKKPERRITWDEDSISGHRRGDLARAEPELEAASEAAAERAFGTGPPSRLEGKGRALPECAIGQSSKSAEKDIAKSLTSTEKVVKVDSKVQIVTAEEAEEAIMSDDDSGDDSDETAVCDDSLPCIQLKPSKELSPPTRGILKRPSSGTINSAGSNSSLLSAQIEAMRSVATSPTPNLQIPLRRGSRTVPRKRSVHAVRMPIVKVQGHRTSRRMPSRQ